MNEQCTIRNGQSYATEDGLVVTITDLFAMNNLFGWKMRVNYTIDDGTRLYPESAWLGSFIKYLDDAGAELETK